jgi:hypothetical protein
MLHQTQFEMENRNSSSTSCRWLIFVVLVALVGLSVSVRAEQVERVLHTSAPTTMRAKADLPSSALANAPQPMLFVDTLLSKPQPSPAMPAKEMPASASPSSSPWYSVSVRHRPPPQHFA